MDSRPGVGGDIFGGYVFLFVLTNWATQVTVCVLISGNDEEVPGEDYISGGSDGSITRGCHSRFQLSLLSIVMTSRDRRLAR